MSRDAGGAVLWAMAVQSLGSMFSRPSTDFYRSCSALRRPRHSRISMAWNWRANLGRHLRTYMCILCAWLNICYKLGQRRWRFYVLINFGVVGLHLWETVSTMSPSPNIWEGDVCRTLQLVERHRARRLSLKHFAYPALVFTRWSSGVVVSAFATINEVNQC